MFRAKTKEAIICFSNLRVTFPYPYAPREPVGDFRGKLNVDAEKCIGCGGCANVCPSRLIRFFDDGEKTRIIWHIERCTYCGIGIYQEWKANPRNFGLNAVGSPKWKILRCEYCGNVQLFRFDGLPEAERLWAN